MQGAEEFAAHLVYTFRVELQVVPRFRIGHHIEAHGVGTIPIDHLERIGHVAHMLAHLVALGIQDESRRDDILEGHTIKDHCSDGMQGEEPTARLIHAFIDEVGRIGFRRYRRPFIIALYHSLAVGLGAAYHFTLKRVMQLSIRHRAAIKPHVNQVALAMHGLTGVVDQYDTIHVGTV